MDKTLPPPRSTLQRVHKCIDFGGGIFENSFWDVPDVDKPYTSSSYCRHETSLEALAKSSLTLSVPN
jgi:hypothetical protein